MGRSRESNDRQPAVIKGLDAGLVFSNCPSRNSAIWETRIFGREPPFIKVGRLLIILPGIDRTAVPWGYLAPDRFS
jgi:hypothetical protein